MNRRISRWVANVLAHPAGFLAFNIFTACWFIAAVWLGQKTLLISLAAYLDVVTWFSSATQFTLAYQNRLAEEQNRLALRNQIDLSRLVLAVAEEVKAIAEELQKGQDAQDEDLEEIQEEIKRRYRRFR